jgi:hypothetical protein
MAQLSKQTKKLKLWMELQALGTSLRGMDIKTKTYFICVLSRSMWVGALTALKRVVLSMFLCTCIAYVAF